MYMFVGLVDNKDVAQTGTAAQENRTDSTSKRQLSYLNVFLTNRTRQLGAEIAILLVFCLSISADIRPNLADLP